MKTIGQNIQGIEKQHRDKFFYGLRRTDDGEVWLGKINQQDSGESLTINRPGATTQNYEDWMEGVDFFDGRDVNHTYVYDNLKYEQYRWDSVDVTYYINDAGELVLRINQPYDNDQNLITYPSLSEVPIPTGPSLTFDDDYTATFDSNELTFDKT